MCSRRTFALIVGMLFACLPASVAQAQKYPEKIVRYVVTDQPGSNIDTLARIVADKLREILGQQIVIDNRAGAGGNIGAEVGAKAPADGHTLVQLATTHAVNVSLYKSLPYSLLKDFTPVTLLASSPSVVVVPASSPLRTMQDLIAHAKQKPGAILYASAGVGTCTFLAGELFKKRADADLLHVPYKGGGPAVTSILSGESGVYFAPVPPVLQHIKQGRLRALAVTSPQPLDLLPDVPPLAAAGVPGYTFSCWYGLFVPAGTPQAATDAIYAAVVAALKDPDLRKRFDALGFVAGGNRPEEFAAYVRQEVETARELVRGIPPF